MGTSATPVSISYVAAFNYSLKTFGDFDFMEMGFEAHDIIIQGEGRNEIDAEALWEDALKVLKQR